MTWIEDSKACQASLKVILNWERHQGWGNFGCMHRLEDEAGEESHGKGSGDSGWCQDEYESVVCPGSKSYLMIYQAHIC